MHSTKFGLVGMSPEMADKIATGEERALIEALLHLAGYWMEQGGMPKFGRSLAAMTRVLDTRGGQFTELTADQRALLAAGCDLYDLLTHSPQGGQALEDLLAKEISYHGKGKNGAGGAHANVQPLVVSCRREGDEIVIRIPVALESPTLLLVTGAGGVTGGWTILEGVTAEIPAVVRHQLSGLPVPVDQVCVDQFRSGCGVSEQRTPKFVPACAETPCQLRQGEAPPEAIPLQKTSAWVS